MVVTFYICRCGAIKAQCIKGNIHLNRSSSCERLQTFPQGKYHGHKILQTIIYTKGMTHILALFRSPPSRKMMVPQISNQAFFCIRPPGMPVKIFLSN